MKIETYGLQPVPEIERKSNWFDLFVIWGGVSFCLPSFIVGALLIPTFSWGEAVLINFIGNLAVGILIVLGGYYGTKTGYPAVIFGRYVFGYPIGQWLPTISLLFSTLGWYAVMTALTGQMLNVTLEKFVGFSNLTLVTIIVGVLNAFTAVFGYQKIRWFSKLSFPILSFFCIIITIKIASFGPVSMALDYQPTRLLTYGEGIDIIIGSFISGAFAASDFSRYAKSNRHNWVGTLSGTFFVSFILGHLGMISMIVTGNSNPLLMIQDMGMGIPVLIFVLLANWTTNDNMLYSSGLAMTNVLPSFDRWKSTLLCGGLGTVLAVLGVTHFVKSWLMMMACIFSPLLGVVLSEFFIIKRGAVHTSINVEAVIAVGGGIFLAKITPPQYMASVVGLLASGLIYIGAVRLNKKTTKGAS